MIRIVIAGAVTLLAATCALSRTESFPLAPEHPVPVSTVIPYNPTQAPSRAPIVTFLADVNEGDPSPEPENDSGEGDDEDEEDAMALLP